MSLFNDYELNKMCQQVPQVLKPKLKIVVYATKYN